MSEGLAYVFSEVGTEFQVSERSLGDGVIAAKSCSVSQKDIVT